jgi:hypothetical protein
MSQKDETIESFIKRLQKVLEETTNRRVKQEELNEVFEIESGISEKLAEVSDKEYVKATTRRVHDIVESVKNRA